MAKKGTSNAPNKCDTYHEGRKKKNYSKRRNKGVVLNRPDITAVREVSKRYYLSRKRVSATRFCGFLREDFSSSSHSLMHFIIYSYIGTHYYAVYIIANAYNTFCQSMTHFTLGIFRNNSIPMPKSHMLYCICKS